MLNRNNAIILLLILLWVGTWAVQTDRVQLPWVTTTQDIDRVTYVYEKDDTIVPRPVEFAIRNLNERGIVATLFEVDTVTGDGSVPTQDAIAKKAAEDTGLPSLVVQAGEHVITVVKNPTTEAEVMEAVK